MKKSPEDGASEKIEKMNLKSRRKAMIFKLSVALIALLIMVVLTLFFTVRIMIIPDTVVEYAPEDDMRYLRGDLPVEFSVVTYNIQGRPILDDTKGKFPEIGQRLEEFDIIGFQECFVHHDYLWEPMEHPVKVFDGKLRNPSKLVGSGLSTASRFPLEENFRMHFTTKGEFQNRVASKGIVLTRFDVHGHTVDVYNTHMEAGRSDEAVKARFIQVEELVEFVHDNSPPEHSVIFMGDFNLRPLREHHTLAYHINENIDSKRLGFHYMMKELGDDFRDASDKIHGVPGPMSLDNIDALWRRKPFGVDGSNYNLNEDVDRVIFRPGEGVNLEPLNWEKHIEDFRADSGEFLSDHHPVSVQFRLEER